MNDRVLLPLGDRLLVLDRATFEAGIAEGDRILPPRTRPEAPIGGAAPPKLLDAAGIAAELGVAVSQVRERVRKGEIPVVRVGRLHRFDLGAVRQALDQLSTDSSIPRKGLADQGVSGRGFTRVSPLKAPGRCPVGARNGR